MLVRCSLKLCCFHIFVSFSVQYGIHSLGKGVFSKFYQFYVSNSKLETIFSDGFSSHKEKIDMNTKNNIRTKYEMFVLQATPENSKLQRKSKKDSSYREFELSRVRRK